MSWRRDQEAALSSVAIAVESSALYVFVGSPRFCVSQAPVCALGLSWCNGTVKVLSSSWTPSLSGRVVVRLRERRQSDSDLLWWFGWSPQFFGFTCVVERQLDLTSCVLAVVLPVKVCHGVGTVVIVVGETDDDTYTQEDRNDQE
ncbi:hypothetical protein Taro_014666 [Colocasia esculenta]|uniref:Uncharacterized protein n=1 Tax=Colocasia esculenta TaxID=4460 RepID=A0A843U9L1_COLES|nr:hypothetical protein [Colocasia esculenta]